MEDTEVHYTDGHPSNERRDANSDHHMSMGKVRLKLCSTKKKSRKRIIFYTTRLRDPCVKEVYLKCTF